MPYIDEHGEICPCPDCEAKDREIQRLDDVIKGLQRDIAGWAARHAELKRDKSEEARAHELWGEAEDAFNEWRALCNHKRARFNADRFWLVLPHLERKGYGVKIVRKAIRGAAYDAFTVRRKNGTTKRFDEWERIFQDIGSIEDFANRAPLDPAAPLR